MSTTDAQLDRALLEVNSLSRIAKANGDLPTMYAANRAWRELHDAYADLRKRRAAMSPADGATKLGSSEPLGPRYDGTTMDNQQLHAGPGGGMTSPDSSMDEKAIEKTGDGE